MVQRVCGLYMLILKIFFPSGIIFIRFSIFKPAFSILVLYTIFIEVNKPNFRFVILVMIYLLNFYHFFITSLHLRFVVLLVKFVSEDLGISIFKPCNPKPSLFVIFILFTTFFDHFRIGSHSYHFLVRRYFVSNLGYFSTRIKLCFSCWEEHEKMSVSD